MDRNLVFMMLVALTAPVLAGCTAQAMPVSTAEEVRPEADVAASKWSADAQLVAIVGVEGSWAGDFAYEANEYQADAAKSDTTTDGRTEFWAFRYVSSSKALAYEILVDRDGNVIAADEDEKEDDDIPIGPYSVDSDEAVRIAFKANDELKKSQQARNHGGVAVLAYDEDHGGPIWAIVGMSHGNDGMQGGMVILDAKSGAVIASMPFSNWDYGGYDYNWSGQTSYPGCGEWC